MRILQLGVGSVGEVTARTVAAVPEVEKVVLADLDVMSACLEAGTQYLDMAAAGPRPWGVVDLPADEELPV
jgi:saccharopine dehydrogenase-like NADP-dependent oxidoreductase